MVGGLVLLLLQPVVAGPRLNVPRDVLRLGDMEDWVAVEGAVEDRVVVLALLLVGLVLEVTDFVGGVGRADQWVENLLGVEIIATDVWDVLAIRLWMSGTVAVGLQPSSALEFVLSAQRSVAG